MYITQLIFVKSMQVLVMCWFVNVCVIWVCKCWCYSGPVRVCYVADQCVRIRKWIDNVWWSFVCLFCVFVCVLSRVMCDWVFFLLDCFFLRSTRVDVIALLNKTKLPALVYSKQSFISNTTWCGIKTKGLMKPKTCHYQTSFRNLGFETY